MLRIGVTGSIATGKSTLLAAFAKCGVPVFSADEAVARLYSGAAVAPVGALFPGVADNGVIDRGELARRLSSDPSGFQRLEAIVHPMVRSAIADFLDDAEAQGHALAAVEVPLLFESGHDYGFDRIAVTYVDEAVQRERILARPGMTVEKMETLLARQMPQAEKKERADWLFDTGLPIAEMEAEVAALVGKLKAERQDQ
ncbi:dephospho-CoA kinase [Devosia subaequoris]|uniref:Dephospho-CoA kinase n=1 Tax=Devosia subaequoris TaxID=395930 RepID=A0A7W6IMN8_9HYPH|nr:dephospho-CoA kinase [Devosia subaequoris]MBB4052410.1 dephospho-CoA kinase [Devosia subaequoris]MCP1209570.1 dephospho-CoA kinase [Devosia subaequoris]